MIRANASVRGPVVKRRPLTELEPFLRGRIGRTAVPEPEEYEEFWEPVPDDDWRYEP